MRVMRLRKNSIFAGCERNNVLKDPKMFYRAEEAAELIHNSLWFVTGSYTFHITHILLAVHMMIMIGAALKFS